MTYKEFYGTQAWKNTRDSYIHSVGGLCERCLAKGLIVPAEVVHHKIYLDEEKASNPNLALCFDNLEALCWSCHEQEHQRGHKGTKQKKRYYVDEFGNVKAIPPRKDEI